MANFALKIQIYAVAIPNSDGQDSNALEPSTFHGNILKTCSVCANTGHIGGNVCKNMHFEHFHAKYCNIWAI